MATTLQSPVNPAKTAPGTFSALRYPNFRLYFGGQLVSTSGTWMQTVAQGWLVFHLTQSTLWLGLVACFTGLPALFLSPFAGVFVERLPRLRILLITQTAQMILAFILSALTFSQTVQVWHVVVLAFLLGVVNSLDAPTRQAFVIDMVGREDLASGITLNSLMFSLSRVIGPTAAGLALVKFGPGWCFLLNGISFLAVLVSLLLMKIQQKNKEVATLSPLRQLREGFRFASRHDTIAPLLLLATITSVFGSNITTLLPAFADFVLHSPDAAYAALVTANGIGAVAAAALVSWLGRRIGRGHIVAIMPIIVSIMVFALALVNVLPLAIVFITIFGYTLISQFVTMNTLIQTQVPNEFRGRVISLYTLTFFGVAPFGALFLGFLGQAIGTPGAMMFAAVVGGGLSAWVLLRSPALRALA